MVYTVKSWFTQICTIRTADMFSPLLVLSPTNSYVLKQDSFAFVGVNTNKLSCT